VVTGRLCVAQTNVACSPALATSVHVAGPLKGRTTGSSPGRSVPESAPLFAFAAKAVAKLAPLEAVDGEDATAELAPGTLVGVVGVVVVAWGRVGLRVDVALVVTGVARVVVELDVTGVARLVVERRCVERRCVEEVSGAVPVRG